MSAQELQELTLSTEERMMFEKYGKGLGGHMANFADPLPTALHSWGNQCIACACGCRGPLSMHRLQTQGLFGVLAHVPGQPPDKNVRHLSGREMALLTGFPKESGWTDNQRLLTAGVGQLASPLQAVWIFAAVFNHLIDHGFCMGDSIPPQQLLACVAMDVFKLRDEWYGNHRTVAMDMFQEQFEAFLEPSGIHHSAGSFQDLTVSQDDDIADAIDSIEASVKTQPRPSIAQPPEVLPANDKPEPESPKLEPDKSSSYPGSTSVANKSTAPDLQSDHVQDRTPGISFTQVPIDEVSHSSFTDSSHKSAQPNQPIWAASGAISAFATNPCKPTAPVVVPVMSTSPSVSPPRHSQLNATPEELVTAGIMIYDADYRSISHQKCMPSATFSQWMQANQAMDSSPRCIHDLFGHEIPPEALLIDLKWIIVSQKPSQAQQLGLPERTVALASLPRLESSLLQGPPVASDEMMFYLTAIAAVGIAKAKPPFIVDGMTDLLVDAKEWVVGLDHVNQLNANQQTQLAHQWIAHQPVQEATATAIWNNSHWTPVWIVPSDKGSVVHTTHEGCRIWAFLFPWWPSEVQVHDELVRNFDMDCGFRTFAWLVGQCTQTPVASLTATEARGWRHLFWQTLVTIPRLSHQFVLGGQSELEVAIQAILKEHGVFASRLIDRTSLLLKSFSTQALSGVFQSARPWQALKQLASNHKPPIRLVLEDELQSAIKARTGDKRSIQAKPKTASTTQAAHHVGPEDILIPHGIFCLQTGEPVAQISPQQIGQITHGIVAFTEKEVQPYLQHAPATAAGLGFLVLSPYSEGIAQQGQIVRFPVQSRLTSEPMLVSAVLLQRGSIPVIRNMPAQPPAVEQVQTQTIKCLLYRDQINDQWQSVVQAPVKFIIGMVEYLQVCKQSACSCPKWHPSQQKSDMPILDVWQRDFLSIHFQKVRPLDAQIYTVAMRVTADVYADLFKFSGTAGLFIEPRTDDGRGQDPRYHTIWVPRKPVSEVKALQSMQTSPVSLIRVSFRYGLKVPAEVAEQVHSQINPDEPFIAGSSKTSYRVGPFPWGTTKKAIQALFHQWSWQARPIHTVAKAKDSSGLMWLVHAASPPAHVVFQLQHGDVVIHQELPTTKEPWRPPQVQAAAGEFKDKKEADFDPWAEAARSLPRQDGVSQAQLATIEANLEQKLVKKFKPTEEPDVAMSSPLEPRVQQLEQQIAALQTRSGVIENKIDYVHTQVEQQSSKFEAALDSKLSDQMQRIEALITKRARSHE